MMKVNSKLDQVKTYDTSRAGMPGEHWIVLGAGLAAWLLTRKHPSVIVRTAGMMAGTALIGRSASGRDGVAKLLRYLPVGKGIRLQR
jgi:hypothetical protein